MLMHYFFGQLMLNANALLFSLMQPKSVVFYAHPTNIHYFLIKKLGDLITTVQVVDLSER